MTTSRGDYVMGAAIIFFILALLYNVVTPAPTPRTLFGDTYSELTNVQGLGKQRVVVVTEGDWTCLRVLTDGAEIGEIVRFNVVSREMRYPSSAPAGWIGRAK